jgi:hypothetical protein
MKSLLAELGEVEQGSPRYAALLHDITKNFDEYRDDGTVWGKGSNKVATKVDNKDDQFIGYTFKRKKVCILFLNYI